MARETSATTAANLASLGAASNPLDGFTRLASNNNSAGLGADGSQFSRLASLGGLAGQANTIARAPSGVGSSAVDAFNRTPSSLIPVGLGGIDRVSSLVGNVAGVAASPAADDHGQQSPPTPAPPLLGHRASPSRAHLAQPLDLGTSDGTMVLVCRHKQQRRVGTRFGTRVRRFISRPSIPSSLTGYATSSNARSSLRPFLGPAGSAFVCVFFHVCLVLSCVCVCARARFALFMLFVFACIFGLFAYMLVQLSLHSPRILCNFSSPTLFLSSPISAALAAALPPYRCCTQCSLSGCLSHKACLDGQGQPGSTVTDGQSKNELKQHMMAHMPHMGVGQAPAGRVPEAWQRPMSGSGAAVDPSIFSRTGSGGFARAGSDGAQPPSGPGVMGHWDPASALAGGVPLAMDVWGMGMHNSPAAHHPSLPNFGFSHEHMALMPPGMYGAHGLQMQMPPSMQSRASLDPQDGGKGKKGRGKKGSKSRQGDPDASARKKRRAEKDVDGAAGSGGEGDDDGQGVEKHNQFLWAKRMGHQNEPRWGLFKQGGSAGPAFLKLLEDLETDGVIERQFGTDLPEQLGGVSGWVVKEGMMPEWQRRRQAWFMEGKEGREFKPNSLYQIMRRLGFFPTMRSSRAGHGHDFEGSSVFRWDADRRYSQRRNSSKAHDSESPSAGGKGVAGSAIMNNMPFGMPVGMNNLPFGIGGMVAGMPGSMISGGVPMGSGTMTKPMMMNPNGAGMINGMPAGFVAAMQHQQQQQRKLT